MSRKVFAGVSVAVLGSLAVAGVVSAQGPIGRYGDGHHDGHPVFGILMMFAFAAMVALVTWLVLRRRPAVAGVPMAAPVAAVAPVSAVVSAETILAERLARSEISPNDYHALLAALRAGVVPPTSSPSPVPPTTT